MSFEDEGEEIRIHSNTECTVTLYGEDQTAMADYGRSDLSWLKFCADGADVQD